MTQDELKKAVGWAALQYVQPGTIVGVGTGSTAAHFIDALGTMKGQIEGAVSSSDASTEKLKSLGIHVFDLNEVDSLGVYVDGADEINGHMQMIKGGGAALTREKIIASVAKKFICIADASKEVDILGNFPLPVEVIPMARSAVARQLVKLAVVLNTVRRRDGQRQRHPRCARSGDPRRHRAGECHQCDSRCGNRRPVCQPWCGCRADRYA